MVTGLFMSIVAGGVTGYVGATSNWSIPRTMLTSAGIGILIGAVCSILSLP